MPDREKVKYSIERCISHVPDACRDCAYDAGHPYNECVEIMLKDALALLKEQEHEVCENCPYKLEDIGDFSDGYHTFNDLYTQRAVLFDALSEEVRNYEREFIQFKRG